MATVHYESNVAAPDEDVWAFVSNIDNWAPFMVGYRSHRVISDVESNWTLRGNTGLLSRTVEIRVQIVEWIERERVSFTIEGLNEPVTGGGLFLMLPDARGEITDDSLPAPRASPWWHAILQRFWRRQLRKHALTQPAAPSNISGHRTNLGFTLTLTAGGMMGPMLNAVIEPLLLPAAETLAKSIAAQIESNHFSEFAANHVPAEMPTISDPSITH